MVFVGAASGLLGDCGPFTDFTDAGFCPFVLEIFYLGITTGTTPTTYEPGTNVSRLQMAAFLSRSVDRALGRGSRRAALDQFWTTKVESNLGLTTVGARPQLVKSDGLDLWVANFDGNSVSHVRGTDGKLLETWTGATSATGVLVAMGRVFVTGALSFPAPGNLYRIDPTQPAGAVTTVASNLGLFPIGLDFDGARIWTANADNVAGSVSIVTPGASIPWTVTTVTTGFKSPIGVVYDGASVWVTDFNPPRLFKLDSAGAILQTVTVGFQPRYPVYDGTNIWVPNEGSDTITVVRAGSGVILQTLTGNGLNGPLAAAFDGQRVLVTNLLGDSVSLWKAADLTPLGFFPTGTNTKPVGACSDGIDFWITLSTVNQIARF
jgi:DNA-binding beta-propeller fold protein YncE